MLNLSRNDLCWCGSGKKYKKCHTDTEEELNKLKKQGYQLPPRSILRSPEQIEGIKKASLLTRSVLDQLNSIIKPGISTQDIDDFVYQTITDNGAKPATLGYKGYPKSCCTSVNEVICHGIPDKNRILQEGDLINVDVTSILHGYYGDSCRMYHVGEISKEAAKLSQVTKECLDLAIEAVKPFLPTNIIGQVIEEHATKHGYSVVEVFGGHGLGLAFHEEPFIYHYARKDKQMIMLPNMTFTIEPMINLGVADAKILKDGWTAVTKDGKLSAQWEHTILVGTEKAEILT